MNVNYQGPYRPAYYPPRRPRSSLKRLFALVAVLVAFLVLIAILAAIGKSHRKPAAAYAPVGPSITTSARAVTPASQPPAVVVPTSKAQPEFPPQVEQARAAAQSYLNFTSFSRAGLIHQLSSSAGDGFPKDVAAQAVDSLRVDWNQQAVESAESYLDFTSFSCAGLKQQLSSSAGDKYTKDQAAYGASHTRACE